MNQVLIYYGICESWLEFRDKRNNTAHDYGVNFAEDTLVLLPSFIKDAYDFAQIIKQQNVTT